MNSNSTLSITSSSKASIGSLQLSSTMASLTPQKPQPTTLTSLPTELFLSILSHLPNTSALSLRAVSKHTHALFHGRLDASLFRRIHISTTNRSLSHLRAISHHPDLRSHVTTIVYNTNRLRSLPTPELATSHLGRNDDWAWFEYQKCYYEQLRLERDLETQLVPALEALPNLRTVETTPRCPVGGVWASDFDVGETPLLEARDLTACLDVVKTGDGMQYPPIVHNTYVFCKLASAVAAARGVKIRAFRVGAGVDGSLVRRKDCKLEIIAEGLADCQQLAVVFDARTKKAMRCELPGLYYNRDVTACFFAKAAELKILEVGFEGQGGKRGVEMVEGLGLGRETLRGLQRLLVAGEDVTAGLAAYLDAKEADAEMQGL